MAANRFATLIHRKTNRITLVLVYAFLEWALIFFLLLNSLFSYIILRFADYFSLKRPCLLCSRLDRFFNASGKKTHSHRDLLCDDHALEISKVPFKPVESKGFIEARLEKTPSPDCALIEPDRSRTISVLEGENVASQERIYTREEETEKKLPFETEETNNDDGETEEEEFSCYVSSFDFSKEVTKEKEEENKVDLAMEAQGTDNKPEESSPERNLEFYIDDHDCHLIPVEFYKPGEEVREISDINGDFILDFAVEDEFTPPDKSKPDYTETNLDDSLQIQNDEETEAEVSIGTEIPDHDQIGDIPSFLDDNDDHHHPHEEVTLEFKAMRPVLNVKNEEQLLEIESFHSLHNAMFHLNRRGESRIESCFEQVLTVDRLKFELEEERKALNALYEELEEERSASAVAANETMAMINRLQEEKAAMQMEALQYQRMMEEQSEFDQEALQLLNELMVKREKENAELEKELEICRRRLEEYEAMEKLGMLRRRIRDSSVDSCRNNGESDENNGEIHQKNDMENTPVDVVLRLDECFDEYEGERLSILGRLKFLEEKLAALNDEEDETEKAKTFENHCSINGNGHFHGSVHKVIKSKRLLPLFDAVDGEIENGNHQENGVDESEDGEIVTVEEEVDELYERLEALEADKEFLRHCVGSLRKGDKGVHLLHEILQHLRDLRNIDLIHVRENKNMTF